MSYSGYSKGTGCLEMQRFNSYGVIVLINSNEGADAFLCACLCITMQQKLIFHNPAQAACTYLTWLAWHP